MKRSATLTQRELDIMSVLWRKKTMATVAEIRDQLTDDLAYPTVQTMLRVLERKGFVDHVQEGRAFRFRALINGDGGGDGVRGRLVSKVYHGPRELLVSRLLSEEEIPADELRRIRKLLQKRIEEKR